MAASAAVSVLAAIGVALWVLGGPGSEDARASLPSNPIPLIADEVLIIADPATSDEALPPLSSHRSFIPSRRVTPGEAAAAVAAQDIGIIVVAAAALPMLDDEWIEKQVAEGRAVIGANVPIAALLDSLGETGVFLRGLGFGPTTPPPAGSNRYASVLAHGVCSYGAQYTFDDESVSSFARVIESVRQCVREDHLAGGASHEGVGD
jgi:hypothetical protein